MLHPEGTRQLRSLFVPKQKSFALAQDDRDPGEVILCLIDRMLHANLLNPIP